MSETSQALVGRCRVCGQLHAAIVVNPRTADSVSRSVKEWRDSGLEIETMTVEEARPQLALGVDCAKEVAA